MANLAVLKGTIWCLHGAVGMAEDWRGFPVPGLAVKRVDLWRFLDCCPMGMEEFGRALNEEAAATAGRRVLLGYSMGGRLALHALLQWGGWDAAVIVSAHPGLEDETGRMARRVKDAEWAAMALKGEWLEFLDAWNSQEVLAAGDPDRDPAFSTRDCGGRSAHATGHPALADRSRLENRRRAVARSFIDWSLGVQEPLAGRLGEIACPVLWVTGGRDGKFRNLAKGLRGVERWIAPGAGHRVPWECAEFPGRVAEFLERAVS